MKGRRGIGDIVKAQGPHGRAWQCLQRPFRCFTPISPPSLNTSAHAVSLFPPGGCGRRPHHSTFSLFLSPCPSPPFSLFLPGGCVRRPPPRRERTRCSVCRWPRSEGACMQGGGCMREGACVQRGEAKAVLIPESLLLCFIGQASVIPPADTVIPLPPR